MEWLREYGITPTTKNIHAIARRRSTAPGWAVFFVVKLLALE
jgi:hypothetical protein